VPENEKDKWAKAAVILQPVGGFLTALAVAALGFFGSQFLSDKQQVDAKVKLYSELMSKREDADTALRKDMLNSTVNIFLQPKNAGYEEKVLALELLTYNFHDAIDLGPLFKQVYKQVTTKEPNQKKRKDLKDRLENLAQEVASKQIAALEEGGFRQDGNFAIADWQATPAGIRAIDAEVEALPPVMAAKKKESQSVKRHFIVDVLYPDEKTKELRVRLQVKTPNERDVDNVFWIGFFDFPMIDNTRLSNGERCSVVLTSFAESAEITLVYFHGSRASLKEKPYYDEVFDSLLRKKSST